MNEEVIKEKYTFREITRRLYNLLFLKDQLNELICDFIDKTTYEELSFSIFNLQELQIIAHKSTSLKEIWANIYQIAKTITLTEENIINRIAGISIHTFLKRFFTNLYFQEEKGFFATKEDYKLSEETCVKNEKEIEELLLNINRNIPVESLDIYSKHFCLQLFKAYKNEVLNPNKFKIPISQ